MREKLILTASALTPWTMPNLWVELISELEDQLGTRLHLLDVRDPVRRKVSSLSAAEAYFNAFEPRETYRRVYGDFLDCKIHFVVGHMPALHHRANRFLLYLPDEFCSRVDPGALKRLFETVIRILRPFYALFDQNSIYSLRTASPPLGSGSYWHEHSGVFWMTHFSKPIVDFFSKAKFSNLPATEGEDGGMTLRLGDDPWTLAEEDRRAAEKELGELSFASYGRDKEPFVHVPHWLSLVGGEWAEKIEKT